MGIILTYTYTDCEPQVIEHPKSVLADIYTSVTFECKAKVYGNFQIQWMKFASTKLPQLATTTIDKSRNGVTSVLLKIDKIIHHYKGYYFCIVKNELGEVNSSKAELRVDGMFSIHCTTK